MSRSLYKNKNGPLGAVKTFKREYGRVYLIDDHLQTVPLHLQFSLAKKSLKRQFLEVLNEMR